MHFGSSAHMWHEAVRVAEDAWENTGNTSFLARTGIHLHDLRPLGDSVVATGNATLTLIQGLPGDVLDTLHFSAENRRLFYAEDLDNWLVFGAVFVILVAFDIFVLNRGSSGHRSAPSFQGAVYHTLFWLFCAACFNYYIYYEKGLDAAFQWGTGYILEWMLSVDNLFVFHRLFEVFATPDNQKHTALFWGIIGAFVFRLILFCIGQVFMHNVSWSHYVFGAFLVYTGFKAATDSDDGDVEEDTPAYKWLTTHLRYIDSYHPSEPRFFMLAKADPQADPRQGTEYRWYGTRLLLVVICLEMTDLIFAFDSVSAIIAQIPDLYLSFTACIFAMLGLRALFFVVDELVKMFTLLNYGVAAILIFIGVKLMAKSYIHVSPGVMCLILMGTLGVSIVASLVYDRYKKDDSEVKDLEGLPEISSGSRIRMRSHSIPKRLAPMPMTPSSSRGHSESFRTAGSSGSGRAPTIVEAGTPRTDGATTPRKWRLAGSPPPSKSPRIMSDGSRM